MGGVKRTVQDHAAVQVSDRVPAAAPAHDHLPVSLSELDDIGIVDDISELAVHGDTLACFRRLETGDDLGGIHRRLGCPKDAYRHQAQQEYGRNFHGRQCSTVVFGLYGQTHYTRTMVNLP